MLVCFVTAVCGSTDDSEWQRAEELITAAGNGDLKTVQRLVAEGISVNCRWRRTEGTTPLCAAASGKHNKIAIFLIRHGANVNLADERNCTPLAWAAGLNNPALLKELIKAGADVNVQDSDKKRTALLLAAHHNDKEIMRILLEQPNIIVRRWDAYGYKALDYAEMANDPESIRMLQDGEKAEAERKRAKLRPTKPPEPTAHPR